MHEAQPKHAVFLDQFSLQGWCLAIMPGSPTLRGGSVSLLNHRVLRLEHSRFVHPALRRKVLRSQELPAARSCVCVRLCCAPRPNAVPRRPGAQRSCASGVGRLFPLDQKHPRSSAAAEFSLGAVRRPRGGWAKRPGGAHTITLRIHRSSGGLGLGGLVARRAACGSPPLEAVERRASARCPPQAPS